MQLRLMASVGEDELRETPLNSPLKLNKITK